MSNVTFVTKWVKIHTESETETGVVHIVTMGWTPDELCFDSPQEQEFYFCVTIHPDSVAYTVPYIMGTELWGVLVPGEKQLAVLTMYASSASFKNGQKVSFAASYPFMMCAETTVQMFINVVLKYCCIFQK